MRNYKSSKEIVATGQNKSKQNCCVEDCKEVDRCQEKNTLEKDKQDKQMQEIKNIK